MDVFGNILEYSGHDKSSRDYDNGNGDALTKVIQLSLVKYQLKPWDILWNGLKHNSFCTSMMLLVSFDRFHWVLWFVKRGLAFNYGPVWIKSQSTRSCQVVALWKKGKIVWR